MELVLITRKLFKNDSVFKNEIHLPTTPSNIFFKLLTLSLQFCPTSVLIFEFHVAVKNSGAIWLKASAIATPSESSKCNRNLQDSDNFLQSLVNLLSQCSKYHSLKYKCY